ncbi:hypothetical protein AK830_g5209 [Neonectria ditissima]|uniref:Apple domain-containing protein n=1 Tax=Neonectria ditissima TaxID=78410 RepID=A0A0P7B5T9_9HYPO|nr:hypothetical protein AK830_g5209 [Neonectria ditissima]
MPSAKTLAIAITALAVSGANAGLCKPDTSTTSEDPSTTTTEACTGYTARSDPPEDATCGTKNIISNEVLVSESESSSLEDCAETCINTENCEVFSNAPATFPGSNFYCKLYSEYTLTPSPDGIQYYQPRCFEYCDRGGRGRGRRRR